MNQLTQERLDEAKAHLAEATDRDARQRLTGVVMAFEWLLEPPGRPSPSEVASVAAKPDPLDHDHDGKKGGSHSGKLATAAKRPKLAKK